LFAVAGTWPTDAVLEPDQLRHIIETVKTPEGFVRGYWGQVPGNGASATAFVVFETQSAADAMASGVRAAIPAASLDVIAVLADA
jgi:hypothetical protein